MGKGISNFQIKNALKNMNNEDNNDNFAGVFPQIIWINDDDAAMISEKTKNIPFYCKNWQFWKGGTHWWSILEFEPKIDILFFDSFRLDGVKHFILQDNREVIEKKYYLRQKKRLGLTIKQLFLIYGLTLIL